MRFFAYFLLFDNGYLYTGCTGRLKRREKEHQKWGGRPKIIWRQAFATREEAHAREVQLKGWSRAKKLALAEGELEKVKLLAKRRGGKAKNPVQLASVGGFQ